jgi:hypothetical protein
VNRRRQIGALSSELEDAGWLGLAAAGFLGFFLLDGKPGAMSATESGTVWTEALNSGDEGRGATRGRECVSTCITTHAR